MLGCPWNAADLEPEALLQMVDEMERVAALLLALVGSEQDADVVRQLQTTFLLLDATYPDNGMLEHQDPLTRPSGREDRPTPATPVTRSR
ncbi:MAG: hypothetical protein M3P93_04535 [Actinomycetota bacterium]|jgi:hypothetical protein|nr:hypothetical protein [Actinomycetota bacterium]